MRELRGKGEVKREGDEDVWASWLEKILTAILKVPSLQTARRKMHAIATWAIEAPVRGESSLIEFTTELEKGLKFASWQAKIFLKGETLAEALTRYELLAYSNFQKSLKMVERAGWNFIDDEEQHPLRKVVGRLRVSVSQVVPGCEGGSQTGRERGGGVARGGGGL